MSIFEGGIKLNFKMKVLKEIFLIEGYEKRIAILNEVINDEC